MHPPVDDGAVAGVLEAFHLAVLVDPVEQVTAVVGQQRLERDPRTGEVRLEATGGGQAPGKKGAPAPR